MSAIQDVRDQLAAIKPSGRFAARQTSPAGDLRLEVKGIGKIAVRVAIFVVVVVVILALPIWLGTGPVVWSP